MQPNGGGFGAGGGPEDPAFVFALLGCMCVFLAVALTVYVLFLQTLSRCLHRVSPRNRTMEPGQVWLNLIPLFNVVWQFITVLRVAESLDNEFYSRRLRADGDFGKTLGLSYLILNLLGAIPYIGVLFSIPAIVCFIIYWVKIAGYSRTLADDRDYDGPADDDRRDDEDDRPRRRRRDEYDDDRDDDRFDRRRDEYDR